MKFVPGSFLFAVFLLSSCGYALVGTGSILDPTLHTLYVPTFVNRTTRVGLEQLVTQSVADEFVSRGRLKLVNDPKQADIILHGWMDTVQLAPVTRPESEVTVPRASITRMRYCGWAVEYSSAPPATVKVGVRLATVELVSHRLLSASATKMPPARPRVRPG